MVEQRHDLGHRSVEVLQRTLGLARAATSGARVIRRAWLAVTFSANNASAECASRAGVPRPAQTRTRELVNSLVELLVRDDVREEVCMGKIARRMAALDGLEASSTGLKTTRSGRSS